MSKVLDFTTRKKEYLTVKLADKKKTVIMIGAPTKHILNEFVAINERITEENGANSEAIDDLYDVCAKVMSFNKGGIKITSDYLADFFDVEDIKVFFKEYSNFIRTITNAKN